MAEMDLDRPPVCEMVLEQLVYTDDDHLLQDKIALKENEFNQKCAPPLWLNDAESPFRWLMSTPKTLVFFIRDVFIRDHKNKLGDEDPDNNFVRFSSLVALMTMTSLNWYQSLESDTHESGQNYSETIKKEYYFLENDFNDEDFKLENVYSKCKSILESLKGDEIFKRIEPAFEHVLQATRAHILYMNGNIVESNMIAQKLQPVEEMSPILKAGIEGLKVQFMFSIRKDTRKILELTKQLVKMDPNFGTWWFLRGRLTRRVRRESKESDFHEEIKLFEQAYKLNPCLKHLLYLAQAYQEVSGCLYKNRAHLSSDSIRDMQIKSVDLFRQSWSIRNDTAAIARRVGNSLMKIKPHLTDMSLAKEALLKAVELSPDKNTYHALGRFYYKLEKDDEKALECFDKAGNVFCGSGEIVRLKIIRDPLYDPYDIVQEWIQVVEVQSKPNALYCDIAWYYLFFHGDLVLSIKYFWKVLKEDFNSPCLLEFSSYVFCVYNRINVIKLLVNEILLFKKENEALLPEKQKDMEFLNSFLAKAITKHPELSNICPRLNVMPDIHRDIKKEIENLRVKRYGCTDETTRHKEKEKSFYERYNRFHSNSESQCNSDTIKKRNGGETMRSDGIYKRGDVSNRKEGNSSGNYNRSGSYREQRSYNRERYDVTITDWRAESRNYKRENPKSTDPK